MENHEISRLHKIMEQVFCDGKPVIGWQHDTLQKAGKDPIFKFPILSKELKAIGKQGKVVFRLYKPGTFDFCAYVGLDDADEELQNNVSFYQVLCVRSKSLNHVTLSQDALPYELLTQFLAQVNQFSELAFKGEGTIKYLSNYFAFLTSDGYARMLLRTSDMIFKFTKEPEA